MHCSTAGQYMTFPTEHNASVLQSNTCFCLSSLTSFCLSFSHRPCHFLSLSLSVSHASALTHSASLTEVFQIYFFILYFQNYSHYSGQEVSGNPETHMFFLRTGHAHIQEGSSRGREIKERCIMGKWPIHPMMSWSLLFESVFLWLLD